MKKTIKIISIVLFIAIFLSFLNLVGVAEEFENLPNEKSLIINKNQKANKTQRGWSTMYL